MSAETVGSAAPKPRAALSRERILRAAVAYLDEHGIEALTMQHLARSLGVGAMSLYNHVKNKDDLLAGIRDLLWDEVAAGAPPSEEPAAWLEAFGRAIRDAARRHPKALALFVASGVLPPALLEVIADQFDRAGGAEPDPKLVDGIATVGAFALGWAVAEAAGLGPASAWFEETERQRIRRVIRALPAETPDRLVDAAIAVCGADAEPMFTAGLAAIVAGCGYRPETPQPSRSTAAPGGSSGRRPPTGSPGAGRRQRT